MGHSRTETTSKSTMRPSCARDHLSVDVVLPAELALAEEGALDGTIAAAIAGHEVIARVTLCRAG
jgi:2-methylcitrate dehydratase PrpD